MGHYCQACKRETPIDRHAIGVWQRKVSEHLDRGKITLHLRLSRGIALNVKQYPGRPDWLVAIAGCEIDRFEEPDEEEAKRRGLQSVLQDMRVALATGGEVKPQ